MIRFWLLGVCLSGKQCVYVWADGIYANVLMEGEVNSRQCLLVPMGATADGQKELIAIKEGYLAKHLAACDCFRKGRDVLLTFYDFPAEHRAFCARRTRSKARLRRSV